MTIRISASLSRAVREAHDRAIGWLLRQQREDGSFHADFGFKHGAAVSWPTAVAISVLPEACDAERTRARDFLRAASVPHPAYGRGWGYNARTPADADTTIESLRALGDEDVDAATFAALRASRGGFATYTPDDAARLYPGKDVRGWTAPHLEITANASYLATARSGASSAWTEVAERAADDLVGWVRLHGYRPYWYPHPIVGASFVLRAIGRDARLPCPPLPDDVRSLDWDMRHNPFVLASALETAMLWEPRHHESIVLALLRRIVASQEPNGAWRPTLVLAVPYPDRRDPRWVQHVNADYGQPVITVATVIRALRSTLDGAAVEVAA